jgi:hypothetical protein
MEGLNQNLQPWHATRARFGTLTWSPTCSSTCSSILIPPEESLYYESMVARGERARIAAVYRTRFMLHNAGHVPRRRLRIDREEAKRNQGPRIVAVKPQDYCTTSSSCRTACASKTSVGSLSTSQSCEAKCRLSIGDVLTDPPRGRKHPTSPERCISRVGGERAKWTTEYGYSKRD